MIDRIAYLFGQTAWPMEMQAPGSAFHLLLSLAGIACAVSAAMFLAGRKNLCPENVLFSCGLLLAFFELYKQGFLYFVVNGRCYNWWYFPFQLCSIPMYLCLAYPFLARPHTSSGKHGVFNTRGSGAAAPILATFLQDFGLLGGFMALAFPEGFLYPYWTLTLHGFFWHFLLIFIGVYCGRRGLSDFGETGFARCLPLYFFCCLAATCINTAVQLTVYPESYADMFYINCFFPSEQPVFSRISLSLGNAWGHIAYLLSSCLGAFCIHLLMRRLFGPFHKRPTKHSENMVR